MVDDVGIRASDVQDLQQRVQELEAENEELKNEFNRMADLVEGLVDENDPVS